MRHITEHGAVMGDKLAEVHRGSDWHRSVNFMLKTMEGPF